MIHTYDRLVNLAHLVGTGDIARLCGVALPTVSTWKIRYDDFPAPVHKTSGGDLYLWPEVMEWHRNRVTYGPRNT